MSDGTCKICGDTEPHHVHDEMGLVGAPEERIENYFLIGRGQTDMEALRSWQSKYDDAQRIINKAGDLTRNGRFEEAHELLKGAYLHVYWRR